MTGVGAGATPSGSVSFYNGGSCATPGPQISTTQTLGGGAASVTTTTLTASSPDTILACYLGDTNYNTTSGTYSQTVNKANSSVTTAPTASAITYGQTLASSTLSNGVGSPAGGSFAFTTPGTTPAVGTAAQGVTYTPPDTTDYNTSTTTSNVTVNKGTPTAAVTLTSGANPSTYGASLTFHVAMTGVGAERPRAAVSASITAGAALLRAPRSAPRRR